MRKYLRTNVPFASAIARATWRNFLWINPPSEVDTPCVSRRVWLSHMLCVALFDNNTGVWTAVDPSASEAKCPRTSYINLINETLAVGSTMLSRGPIRSLTRIDSPVRFWILKTSIVLFGSIRFRTIMSERGGSPLSSRMFFIIQTIDWCVIHIEQKDLQRSNRREDIRMTSNFIPGKSLPMQCYRKKRIVYL